MSNQMQENSIMHLVQSVENIKEDFFGEVLGFHNADIFFQIQQENICQKKLQFDLNSTNDFKNHFLSKLQGQSKNEIAKQFHVKNICKKQTDEKDLYSQLKNQEQDQKNQNSYFQKNREKTRRITRCTSKIESEQVQLLKQQKNFGEVITDFTNVLNQTGTYQSKNINKRSTKFMKKVCKYIFKQKQFGKTFKISFPKKVVQMFINHYEEYPIQNELIKKYNDSLKQRLKQNKKNDYTFEKQVSQILGENIQQLQQEKGLMTETSITNRKAFCQIIRQTMKQQVIMRDKIAKNRQLYMIQLKVYALRCRSHKLAKKGTFK